MQTLALLQERLRNEDAAGGHAKRKGFAVEGCHLLAGLSAQAKGGISRVVLALLGNMTVPLDPNNLGPAAFQ